MNNECLKIHTFPRVTDDLFSPNTAGWDVDSAWQSSSCYLVRRETGTEAIKCISGCWHVVRLLGILLSLQQVFVHNTFVPTEDGKLPNFHFGGTCSVWFLGEVVLRNLSSLQSSRKWLRREYVWLTNFSMFECDGPTLCLTISLCMYWTYIYILISNYWTRQFGTRCWPYNSPTFFCKPYITQKRIAIC